MTPSIRSTIGATTAGSVWCRPTGEDQDPDLQRCFTLPDAFFDDAVLDRLELPGYSGLYRHSSGP